MLRKHLPLTLVALILLALTIPTANAETNREVIVWFWDEDSQVIETGGSDLACIYSGVQEIFQNEGLIEAKPLFRPNSVLRNVFLLSFPSTADMEGLLAELNSAEEIREAFENADAGEVHSSPSDYAWGS